MGNQALYFVALNFHKAVDGNGKEHGTGTFASDCLVWKSPSSFHLFLFVESPSLGHMQRQGGGRRLYSLLRVTTVFYGEGEKIELGN